MLPQRLQPQKIIEGFCVYSWPNHYPTSCPPSDAVEVSGIIYRFINGTKPVPRDFVSHYEREPNKDWGKNGCKARGLSVLRNMDDCNLMRKAIPALRKKRIATATVTTTVGLIAVTPSESCKGHCTWWRAPNPDDVAGFFSTVIDPNRSDHA